MKNIKLFIAILSIFLLSACQDEFLDVENKNSLTVDNWYASLTDFELATNSAYACFEEVGMHGLSFQHYFGSFDDRIIFETTARDRISMFSNDGNIQFMWRNLYMGNYRCTRILQKLKEKGLDGIKDMSQEDYDYIEAQARALRGGYYYYLITIFDKPILVDEATLPDDYLQDMTNGTHEELWAMLEGDLEAAIPNLPSKEDLSDEELGRMTSGATKAILAKSLLFKYYYYYARNDMKDSPEAVADLQRAKELFLDIMNGVDGDYHLIQPQAPYTQLDYTMALLSNSSYLTLPSENNSYPSENNAESLWEVQFADGPAHEGNVWLPGSFNPGELNYRYYSPHDVSYKNWEVNPAMYFEFESDGAPAGFDIDPRAYAAMFFTDDPLDFRPDSPYTEVLYATGGSNKSIGRGRKLNYPSGYDSFGVKKYFYPTFYEGTYSPANAPFNRRLIRYAEVLLMYAEIQVILGDDGSGLAALNEVRQRVDMPDATALTRASIMHERDVEFCFEGMRWFDLIRWSFDDAWGIDWNTVDWGINGMNSVNPFQKGKHEFMPIPLYEIDMNGGALVQNPGW